MWYFKCVFVFTLPSDVSHVRRSDWRYPWFTVGAIIKLEIRCTANPWKTCINNRSSSEIWLCVTGISAMIWTRGNLKECEWRGRYNRADNSEPWSCVSDSILLRCAWWYLIAATPSILCVTSKIEVSSQVASAYLRAPSHGELSTNSRRILPK